MTLFKLWLSRLGKERIDETFDPELAIVRAIKYYLKKGYDEEWIEKRIKGIQNRKHFTDVWKDGGIKEGFEYAILTDAIYGEWADMTAQEYKQFKELRKESLRDNMTRVEVLLTDLGEIATEELAKEHKPYGLVANKKVAKAGGDVAKVARSSLEQKLGKSVISKENKLAYKYIDDEQKLFYENNKDANE